MRVAGTARNSHRVRRTDFGPAVTATVVRLDNSIVSITTGISNAAGPDGPHYSCRRLSIRLRWRRDDVYDAPIR